MILLRPKQDAPKVVDKTRLPATSQLGPFSLVKTREMDPVVC